MFENREWHGASGASEADLRIVQNATPVTLPECYLQLLATSNGGEGPLPVQPYWVCLFPALEVVQAQEIDGDGSFFRGLFVIGGNGGGEAIAIDLRAPEPHPVVAFDMTNIDLEESILSIAPTFKDFVGMIGRTES